MKRTRLLMLVAVVTCLTPAMSGCESPTPKSNTATENGVVAAGGATKDQPTFKTVEMPICGLWMPRKALDERESGTARVRICVGVNSDRDRPVELVKSSGYSSVDEAAINCASKGKFKAAMVNGQPLASCRDMLITIKHE